jgi:hypothetical protein
MSMGSLTRTVAGLALTATAALSVVAAVNPSGINGGGHAGVPGLTQATGGVIQNQTVGGSGSLRILATDGVIHAQLGLGASGAVPAPADNGVISSHD